MEGPVSYGAGKSKRRLEIARKIAAEALQDMNRNENSVDESKAAKSGNKKHNSSNIVFGRNATSLYSLFDVELNLENRHSLEKMIETLTSPSFLNLSSFESISRITAVIEGHITPCCVYVWDVLDGGDMLKVNSASSNSKMLGKTLNRGEGITFLCLEYKLPILVKSISQRLAYIVKDGVWETLQPNFHIKHFIEEVSDTSSNSFLSDETSVRPDSYLAVPLRYGDQIIGVLGIDGFTVPGITSPACLLRAGSLISSRLVNDFQNLSKVCRVYRHGVDVENKTTRMLHLSTTYKYAANIVEGRIKSMEHTKNGVTFVGGPRFHVQWEDGVEETEVRQSDLSLYLCNSRKSLGYVMELSPIALNRLIQCGPIMGDLFGKAHWEKERQALLALVTQNLPNFGSVVSKFMQILFCAILYCKRIEVWEARDPSVATRPNSLFVCTAYMDKSKMRYQACDKEPSVILPNSAAEDLRNELRMIGKTTNLQPCPEVIACGFSDKIAIKSTRKQRKTPNFQEIFRTASFALVIYRKHGILWHEDNDCLSESTKILQVALHNMRQRNSRHIVRQDLFRKIDVICAGWRFKSEIAIMDEVMGVVSQSMLGSFSYVGLLDHGCNNVHYLSSTAGSVMRGQKLARGEGVSFAVIDSAESKIFREPKKLKDGSTESLTVGSTVNILYTSAYYKGVITRLRGHETFDVIYDFDKTREAGVSVARLRYAQNEPVPLKFGNHGWPFVCVPVCHETKVVGIIGMDSFENSPITAGEGSHPERSGLKFLEDSGLSLGKCIDMMRKYNAMTEIRKVSVNRNSADIDVWSTAIRSLHSVLLNVDNFLVVYWDEQHAASSKHFRLRSCVVDHKEMVPTEIFISASSDRSKSKLFNLLESVDLRTFVGIDMESVEIQNPSDNEACCFWKLPIANSEKTTFVTWVIYSPKKIAMIDVRFFQDIGRVLHASATAIRERGMRSSSRERLVESLAKTSSTWKCVKPFVAFLMDVLNRLSRCFFEADIYIGVAQMGFNQIKFIASSTGSSAHGCMVRRDHCATMKCVDNRSTLTILNDSDDASHMVSPFVDKSHIRWPFIAAPVVFNGDGAFGVIASDGIISAEASDNVSDVADCLKQIGCHIGTVFHKTLLLSVLCNMIGGYFRHENSVTSKTQLKKKALSFPLFKEYEDCIAVACPLVSSIYIAELAAERSVWSRQKPGNKLSLISKTQPSQISIQCSLIISKVMVHVPVPPTDSVESHIGVKLLGRQVESRTVVLESKNCLLLSDLGIRIPITLSPAILTQSHCNMALVTIDLALKGIADILHINLISAVDVVRMNNLNGQEPVPHCIHIRVSQIDISFILLVTDWLELDIHSVNDVTTDIPANLAIASDALCQKCIMSFVCIFDKRHVIENPQENVLVTWSVACSELGATNSSIVLIESQRSVGEVLLDSFQATENGTSFSVGTGDVEISFTFVMGAKSAYGKIQGNVVSISGGLPKIIAIVDENGETLDMFLLCKIIPCDPQWSIEEAAQKFEADVIDKEASFQICLTLIKAEGLARPSLLNDCDPKCDIMVGGQVIGSTKTLFSTCNPVWEEENFTITVSKASKVEIAVFDMELGGLKRGSFLGMVELSSDIVAYPPVGSIRFPLLRNFNLPSKNQTLVQGDIYVRLARRSKTNELESERVYHSCSAAAISRPYIRASGNRKMDSETLSWESMFPYAIADIRQNCNKPFNPPSSDKSDPSRILTMRMHGKPKLFQNDAYVGRMSCIASIRDGIEQRCVDSKQFLYCNSIYSGALLETMLVSSRKKYYEAVVSRATELCCLYENNESGSNIELIFDGLSIGQRAVEFITKLLSMLEPLLCGASIRLSLARSRKKCLIYAYPPSLAQTVAQIEGDNCYASSKSEVNSQNFLFVGDLLESMKSDNCHFYPSHVEMSSHRLAFPVVVLPIKSDSGNLIGCLALSDLSKSGRMLRSSCADPSFVEFMESIAAMLGTCLFRRSIQNGLEIIEQAACLSSASLKTVLTAANKAVIGNLCQCNAVETWSIDKSVRHDVTVLPVSGVHNEYDEQSKARLRKRLMTSVFIQSVVSSDVASHLGAYSEKLLLKLQCGDRSVCLPICLNLESIDAEIRLKHVSCMPNLLVNSNRRLIVEICGYSVDKRELVMQGMDSFWKDFSHCVDPSLPADSPTELLSHKSSIMEDFSNALIESHSCDFEVLYSGEASFRTFTEEVINLKLLSTSGDMLINMKLFQKFVSDMVSAGSLLNTVKVGKIGISVNRADNLAKSDTFGSSDPMVECYFNNALFGSTKTIKNCLNPEWNESVEILNPDVRSNSVMTIMVWDMDTFGKGSLLGEINIPSDIFLNPPLEECEYTLQKSQSVNKRVKQVTQGTIFLRHYVEMSQSSTPTEPSVKIAKKLSKKASRSSSAPKSSLPGSLKPGSLDKIEIEILNCSDLAKADLFGKSDPMVVVTFNGSDVGCTKTKFNTLEPEWTGEIFCLDLPKPDIRNTSLGIILQVWDMDVMIRGDFLGQAMITPICCYSAGKEFGQPFTFPLQQSSKVSKYVQGTISFRIRRISPISAAHYEFISPSETSVVAEKFADVSDFSVVTVEDYDAEMQRMNEIENLALPERVEMLKASETLSKKDSIRLFGNGMIDEVVLGQLIHSNDSGQTTLSSSSTCDIAVVPIQDELTNLNCLVRCEPGKMSSSETLKLCKLFGSKTLECLRWIHQRDYRIQIWRDICSQAAELLLSASKHDIADERCHALITLYGQACSGQLFVYSDFCSRNIRLCTRRYAFMDSGTFLESFEECDFDISLLNETLRAAKMGFSIMKFRGSIKLSHSSWKSVDEGQMKTLDDCKGLSCGINWESISIELSDKNCFIIPSHSASGNFLGLLYISGIDSLPYLLHNGCIKVPENGFANATIGVAHAILNSLAVAVKLQELALVRSLATAGNNPIDVVKDILSKLPVLSELFLLQCPKAKNTALKFSHRILEESVKGTTEEVDSRSFKAACDNVDYRLVPISLSPCYEGCENILSYSAIYCNSVISSFNAKLLESSKKSSKGNFLTSMFKQPKVNVEKMGINDESKSNAKEFAYYGKFTVVSSSSVSDHWKDQASIARLLADEILLHCSDAVISTVTFLESGETSSNYSLSRSRSDSCLLKSSLGMVLAPLRVSRQAFFRLWEDAAQQVPQSETSVVRCGDALLVQDYTVCIAFQGNNDNDWFDAIQLQPFIDIILDYLNSLS